MSLDPFGGAGGTSSLPFFILSAIARCEHLLICEAARDVAVGFEKLAADAETDLGRLRKRKVRWQFVARVQ